MCIYVDIYVYAHMYVHLSIFSVACSFCSVFFLSLLIEFRFEHVGQVGQHHASLDKFLQQRSKDKQ